MRIASIVFVVVALAGCERPDDAPPLPEEPAEPARFPAPEPEPFDTAAVIEEARALEREADAGQDALTRLERTVDADAPGGDPLRLVLWEREGRPARLQVGSGEEEPVVYYFDERARLRVIRHPAGMDILDTEGRLLVRLDAAGELRGDLPPADRVERATRLEIDARHYLDAFVRAD